MPARTLPVSLTTTASVQYHHHLYQHWLNISSYDSPRVDGQQPGCVYQKALQDLCRLKEEFPVAIANILSHCIALLLQEWAMHR